MKINNLTGSAPAAVVVVPMRHLFRRFRRRRGERYETDLHPLDPVMGTQVHHHKPCATHPHVPDDAHGTRMQFRRAEIGGGLLCRDWWKAIDSK